MALAPNYSSIGSAGNGPMRLGDVGVVAGSSDSVIRYQALVSFNGTPYAYPREALVVVGNHPSAHMHVEVPALIYAGSPMALSILQSLLTILEISKEHLVEVCDCILSWEFGCSASESAIISSIGKSLLDFLALTALPAHAHTAVVNAILAIKKNVRPDQLEVIELCLLSRNRIFPDNVTNQVP